MFRQLLVIYKCQIGKDLRKRNQIFIGRAPVRSWDTRDVLWEYGDRCRNVDDGYEEVIQCA